MSVIARSIATKQSPTLQFELDLWNAGFTRLAGIDEAGRGAWAGPVCSAAVILPPDPSILQRLDQVRDSKLMTPLARENWAPRIRQAALAWGIGFASSQEVDALGILPATKLAATRALLSLAPDHPIPDPLLSTLSSSFLLSPDFPIPDPFLSTLSSSIPLSPDYLLTDYLVFPNLELPQTALVKGDRLSLSIAAASVLAKTSRDAWMCAMDERHPGYNFARHKGYGTRHHRQAIRQLGLCEIHRKSFSFSF